jgi:3-oxoacyl-[acyl-carrier protein] reductase
MHIVVTGSSSGIGRALVERLLSHGHEVEGWARSDQQAFAAAHTSFSAASCDVADWTQVSGCAERLARRWSRLDALVCCAGQQGEIGPALKADPLRWSETLQQNVNGVYFPLRALRSMLLSGMGRAKAVCFSGGGAAQARPGFSAYASAKTAIVRLVETIAQEESRSAIDINAIAPGAIYTRMTEEVLSAGASLAGKVEYEAAQKLKQAGSAPLTRALDCVEWLLSPESDGLSGRLISAPWDPWNQLASSKEALGRTDVFQLRRIRPQDRGLRL